MTQNNGYLNNRHEFLFLYDVSWANPNGDPMEENSPRIDEETRINIVTSSRFKRTIRDTLYEMGHEIFLRRIQKSDGTLMTKEDLVDLIESNPEKVFKYIDIRLFGATFTIKNDKKKKKKKKKETEDEQSLFNTEEGNGKDFEDETEVDSDFSSLTGAVQFKFGHSLHKVIVKTIRGTTIIPSGEKKKAGTFTDTNVVPYSLIVFYGIANEKGAKVTKLTEKDIDEMLKAIWVGHKAGNDVLTYSKLGHEPRLLLDIVYKPGVLTHMGELDKLVKFDTAQETDEERAIEMKIRDITDGTVNLSGLAKKVSKYKDKIGKVRFCIGDRVEIQPSLEEVFSGIKMELLPLE